MRTIKYIYLLLLYFGLSACGSDSKVNKPIVNYTEQITAGWSEFANQNYSAAIEIFNSAKTMSPDSSYAYIGLGWAYFKNDQLYDAVNEFSDGYDKNDVNVIVSADITAGWAFVLNAQKLYSESNNKIEEALFNNPDWSFSHGLVLNQNHLILLKAENFYLLGFFGESLSAIQELNPSFVKNILSSEGRAALALEIERLKATL